MTKNSEYAQFKCAMVGFGEKKAELKNNFEQKPLVLKKLYSTPCGALIKAYQEGKMTVRKSNLDVKEVCNCYDTTKKKFKFQNGYSHITTEDVVRIYGIPNKGTEAPKTTNSRKGKPGVSRLTDKFFSATARPDKRDLSNAIELAFEDDSERGQDDAACLIVLYLLITLLLANSGNYLPWSYVQACESVEQIETYNWAREIKEYLQNGIHKDQVKTEETGKQSAISGCVMTLLYWLCNRGNMIKPIEGREKSEPTAVRWDLHMLHKHLQKIKNIQIKSQLRILHNKAKAGRHV
nr:uncharacterized protein LOC103444932 isoform X2 [Malus domestica]XP_028957896.1 uncharacterized protein LOC103444932 isoform X2 [Malus domestica]